MTNKPPIRLVSENTGADATEAVSPEPKLYNEEYFERGAITGISGYVNYSWMPELTMRMAHLLIRQLPIGDDDRVLDYGCAKGFMVKALRLLEIDAWGVDVSEYAVRCADGPVQEFCQVINGCDDPNLFARDYDWMLAKDVLEHVGEADLSVLFTAARPRVKRVFAAIPLGKDDSSGKFVIPSYDEDITHVTAKTPDWWHRFFADHGWTVEHFSFEYRGCKENWTSKWPEGNGFFVVASDAAG